MSTIVETERLIIRYWTSDDVNDAFTIYGDPEVTRYLAGDARDTTIEQTSEWLAKKLATQADKAPLGLWAAEERATGRVIGHALLQYAQINGEDRVEVGYALARAAWGNGYATEIARAILRVGFDTLNLAEIYGVVIPENTASRRVLEKIGMRNLGMGDYNGFPIEVLAMRANDYSGH
ncbi:MAG TPA: GNAT family N-acetyltransferase [Thermomicrobiales bacterium]|nr:GNAT family N-acetyltransferase [Thermomicrobiales bacterium]